ncbi:MAG: hypothetical protein QOJ71_350 [Actinomycetota bacterium]|nr:hypothetical protein [Actinomycetota bacterium]
MPPIDPMPPLAGFELPWDSIDGDDPVVALTDARARLGDTFVVESGGVTYLFTFGEAGLRSFYAVAERDASKGLADYRMLVRKMPDELFAERRTFAHDLFGAEEVQGYLDNLDWAIDAQITELGDAGSFDVFELSRRVGHRLGIACWLGREAPIDELVPEFEILDGAEAFVHPSRSKGATKVDERAALARVELVVGRLLERTDRAPSFLDDIAHRWDDVEDPRAGVAGDVVLLHIATMTNLFAALAWTLAQVLLHPSPASLEQCAFEAARLGQRSIMLREVLRPISFSDGEHEYRIERGVQLATMLPLTNSERVGSGYEPERWRNRALHHDVTVTTFGHGAHRCPAQRFSVSAIVRTVERLRETFVMTPVFTEVVPLPGQIGGVARSAEPCAVSYRRVPATDVFIGGAESVDIVIVDYDTDWPVRFEAERARIVAALGPRALAVDHIGSTSVPGLAAKPIIDVCVTVVDSADETSYLGALVDAGYELRVREPEFHEHRMLRTPAHDVHVHVFTLGSDEITRYLAFRDRLRADDADRTMYAETKRTLAQRDWPSMQHYADAKTAVVEAVIARALGARKPA